VSAGCYRLWESPLRASNVTWGLIAAVAAPAAIVAAVVTLAPPKVPAEFGQAPVTLAGSGGSGSLTVLVAGDSWARNMGYGLALADSSHRHTFIDLGTSGCGIAPGQSTDCQRGQQEWSRAVVQQQPDVALLMVGTVDQDNGAVVNGARTYPCSTAFDAAYAQALDRTIAALRGPHGIPVYVTTVRDNTSGKQQESSCMNRLLTAAAARDHARVLDLHAQLCPNGCVGSVSGKPVYDDTMHLAPAGQRWIGSWILGTLQREVNGRAATQSVTGPCVAGDAARRQALDVAQYRASASKTYPDSAKHTKLTDGKSARPTVWDPGWMGWQQQSADISVQLPRSESICAVESTWLQELDAAVYPPSSIAVFVSSRPGQLGKLLAVARAPQISSDNQTATETALAGTPITGRYITLRVTALNGWSFVDEVSPQGLPRTNTGGHR
jgi:lysophospholipase L1-like esterase